MFKAAVIQASSVLFDQAACLQKAEALVREASSQGANLVVFPEAYIPAYPRGLSFGTVVGSRSEKGREVWLRYWENSLEIPGPAVTQLGTLARAYGVWLVMGIIEREPLGGTLFCTLVYFDPTGELLGKHRKLKPTAAERIIWGEGDGKDLTVYPTPHGRIGGLICWENYMPEARMRLYRQGIDIYLAPTADQRDTWQATLRHIAFEGRSFVLGCNQYVTREMYPKDILDLEPGVQLPEVLSRGGSVIVSPLGKVLAGPLWDQEAILYADLHLREVAKSKLEFDVVGHYARPDIFS